LSSNSGEEEVEKKDSDDDDGDDSDDRSVKKDDAEDDELRLREDRSSATAFSPDRVVLVAPREAAPATAAGDRKNRATFDDMTRQGRRRQQ
jgi:hypothetical protein